MGGAGEDNEAALAFGGYDPGAQAGETENWNGTSWTEVADLNQQGHYISGTGSSTAAIVTGGNRLPAADNSVLTETWNGSSWTEVGDLGTASRYMANGRMGSGVSALCAGGSSSGPSQFETTTQEWALAGATKTLTTT